MTEGFLRGQGNMGTNRMSWVGFPWLRVRKEGRYDDVYTVERRERERFFLCATVSCRIREHFYVSRVWGAFI